MFPERLIADLTTATAISAETLEFLTAALDAADAVGDRERILRILRDHATGSVPADDPLHPPGSAEILALLHRPDLPLAERCRTIVLAETRDFAAEDKPALAERLWAFAAEHACDPKYPVRIAVGAAVRKLCASLPFERLDETAALIDPSRVPEVPVQVELELAKSVARRMTHYPAPADDALPLLGDQFFEMARTYLQPRLLARDYFGAAALNAILALSALRSRHVPALLERLREEPLRSFAATVRARSEDALNAMRRRSEAELLPIFARCFLEARAVLPARTA